MVASEPRLRGDIDEIMPGVVADRRHLHQHPELGFQEFETAKFVAERLRSLGIEDVRTGVGKTGVTGLIRGGKGDGKVVLVRADMDALPIEELNEVEYRSQNPGVMHACGHDTHVSMLLGTARMLNERREQFAGTVKVVFQPAEEGGGGAMAMIADGALSDPAPDASLGLHIWQEYDLGIVAARAGTAMVGADRFEVVVRGKGGHGGLPHLTIDPVAIGAQIIVALQTIVSRENDPSLPAVVTAATLQAGTAGNVIPDTATVTGTIRTVTQEQREMIPRRIQEVARGVAAAMRAEAEVTIRWGVPPLVNDPAMTEIVRESAAEVVGEAGSVEGQILTVSEDMSEFLDRVPGCYFFVGSRNAERGLVWGHHHARFDVDEDAMAIGIETMTRSVLRYLGT
jgi:amidohydrolase